MTAVAHTSYGALRGDASGDVLVFRGVPYAAAPMGELRWRPPQPAASWAGVRDAIAFGAVAPQDISPRAARQARPDDERGLSHPQYLDASRRRRQETCAGLPARRRPDAGLWVRSPVRRCATRQARRHRGGDDELPTRCAGHAYAPDWHGADTTNLTMRDQRQALQWVREEIGAFGGDPGAITVAGQSSGAIATAALLAGGCDLFDRAVLQSGGLERVRSTAAASAVAEQFIATGAFTRVDEPACRGDPCRAAPHRQRIRAAAGPVSSLHR